MAVASGRGIANLLGSSVEPIHTSKDLVRLQNAGRQDVADLVRQAGRRLGALVGGAMATLNPQLVVVGGNLAEDNAVLLDEIRAVAPSRVHPLAASATSIIATPISDEGGLRGAAHLALRHVLEPTSIDRALQQGVSLGAHRAG